MAEPTRRPAGCLLLVTLVCLAACGPLPAATPAPTTVAATTVVTATSTTATGVPTATATPPAAPDSAAASANADVLFVRAVYDAPGTWRFDVTVTHPDSGWEDYADGWDVVLPDDTVLKVRATDPFTRLLLHPHETEQSFTRSQGGLTIPEEVTIVRVRAHDIVAGFGGREVVIDLTTTEGPDYVVER